MKKRGASAADRVYERLGRRFWPIVVSAVFVVAGLCYVFAWGSVGQHTTSLWISPQDLWISYFAASQLAHGHIGAIYQANASFVEFPGILLALAPLGALSNAFHTPVLEIVQHHTVPAQGVSMRAPGIPFLNAQEFHFSGNTYVSHPQWVAFVDPYILLLSCSALFAFDALAERLQVSRERRIALCIAEAVLLWNVTLWWGHPEDAVAVAFAVYALVLALDGRFVGAGWLFGAAVAFQPLVLLMLPVLVAMAWRTGRREGIGLALRSVIPAGVLLAVPLIANFHVTLRALADQPSSPNVNHATPWTALSPSLGGRGANFDVAAGPVRVLAILLAVGLGYFVYRKWLERPELLAWACALALALRSYTESVMTDYYAWAALAVALAVAARGHRWRFVACIPVAVATTVVAQWKLGWAPWWTLQIVGLTVVLLLAARPEPLVAPKQRAESGKARRVPVTTGSAGKGSKGANQRARANQAAPVPARGGKAPVKKSAKPSAPNRTSRPR